VVEHNHFLNRHRRQRQRNFKALKDDFETLLEKHCKLLLVRVDVSYPYDADIDICQFDADLNVFEAVFVTVGIALKVYSIIHGQLNREGTKDITVIFFLSIMARHICVMVLC
jgi:hypothetical protein